MLTLTLLFLFVAGAAAHRPWDWKNDRAHNIGSFDDSSSTSTSSTSDSSSTDSRIAKAVEAALRAAQHEPEAQPEESNSLFETFRLRLSTTSRENTCSIFQCTEVTTICADGAAQLTALQGAVATVTTSTGSFDAVFDATGTATQLNDDVAFTVTYDGCQTFTLTTQVGLTGVNATALTISTQPCVDAATGSGPLGMAYFRAREADADASGVFDFTTGLNDDGTVRADNGEVVIGCDATFDDINAKGYTSFTVTATGSNAPNLVQNTTGEITATFTVDRIWTVNPVDADTDYGTIGLNNLPCASRSRVIYDEIAIATLRSGDVEVLDHPLLYDALQAGTAGTTPSFDNFIFQLQVAAGRTQIRLRDATIDSGAFSILSHNSKFTPCFRVFKDDDSDIRVYIGIRNGGGAFVEAVLKNQGTDRDLLQIDDGVVTFRDLDDVPEDDLPVITVQEIVPADLTGATFVEDRPITRLRSDVKVLVEECPVFTYFQ